jgi:hypothetical protein
MVPPRLPDAKPIEEEPEEVLPTPIGKEITTEVAPLIPTSTTILKPQEKAPKTVTAQLTPVSTTVLTPSTDSTLSPETTPTESTETETVKEMASITPISTQIMTPATSEEEADGEDGTSSLTPVSRVMMTPQIPIDDLIQDAEEEIPDEADDSDMDSMIESIKVPTIAGIDTKEEVADEAESSRSRRGPPPSTKGSKGPPRGTGRGPPPSGTSGRKGPPDSKRGPPPGAGRRGPPPSSRSGPPSNAGADDDEEDYSEEE